MQQSRPYHLRHDMQLSHPGDDGTPEEVNCCTISAQGSDSIENTLLNQLIQKMQEGNCSQRMEMSLKRDLHSVIGIRVMLWRS
uniref:Uncharacterized protein n=1 Tax=Setaria digitata TaxID=48799 RepID=A0A915PKE4_9BILA